MTEAVHTRTRRPFSGPFPPSQSGIRASDTEVSKDLQQFYQCSSSQVAVLLATQRVGEGQGSGRNKVGVRQRKRMLSGKETETMDAVLGLASFVSESELPVKPSSPRAKRHLEPDPKPKSKPAPKPAPYTAPKPKPPPPVPRKAPVSSHTQPYQLPFGYPFALTNYLYPYLDKNQPMMSMIPGLTMPPQNLYPQFGMMYQQGMYGTPGWSVPVAPPAPVLHTSMQQSRVYKRSARHVAIAFFIRVEEGKKKPAETGSPSKFARYM